MFSFASARCKWTFTCKQGSTKSKNLTICNYSKGSFTLTTTATISLLICSYEVDGNGIFVIMNGFYANI